MRDPAAELYVALVRLVRELRREAPTEGLAAGGLSALFTLARGGPLRATALAQAEGVSAASMTRIVDRLCAEGFAERTADPDDGRAQLVGATAAGHRVVREGKAARLDALRRRVAALDEVDQQRLGELVEVLSRLS